jgi:phage protein D
MANNLNPDVKIKIDNKEISQDMEEKFIKLKVSSSANAMDMAKIVFLDTLDCEVQKKSEIAIGKSISISLGYDSKLKEIFVGEIYRIDYNFSINKMNRIELVCFDKLFKLNRIRHSQAFVKMKDSDIAKKLAAEAGLQCDVDATKQTIDYLFQNNQTNLDFLKMRAKRIGYEVAIDGSKFIFKKDRYSKNSKCVTLNWGEGLIEFSAKVDSSNVLEEIVVSSWDPVKKEGVEGKAVAGNEAKVASPKKKGTQEVKSKIKDKAKNYKIDIPNLKASEAKSIAKAELARRSMDFLTATGTCVGNPDIKASKIITIKNVGTIVSGDYYVVSCEHLYGANGYKTIFEAKNNGYQ